MFTLKVKPVAANTTSSKVSKVAPEILSAPLFVVVTIKFPLPLVLNPYTSGEDTPVKAEPSIAGSVPVIFAAGIFVKLAALAAGKVAGNLASGTVPDVRLDALKAVKSIVSNVGSAPLLALKNLPSLDAVPCGNLSSVTA